MTNQPNIASISVIIPVKNRAGLLEITLDNIFAQTLLPAQVIVVDDGSTDHLPQVIAKYEGRVTCIPNEGKGPGAARNTGLKIADTAFVKFFDSDDVMTKNCLQAQYEVLQKTGAPLVYSPYIHAIEQPDGSWLRQGAIVQYQPFPATQTLRACMAYNFFTVIPGFMFRREFLEKLGAWRTDITAYEDWDYLWRIGKLCPNPVHTNQAAMIYRLHGAQTTGAHFDNTQRDKEKVICLKDALAAAQDLSPLDKLALTNILWKTLKSLAHLPEYQAVLAQYDSPAMPFISLYLRLKNKLERLKTHSDWTTMHGVSNSEEVWGQYAKLL
ncbi:hypothetical protein SAMN05421780_102369 [Flexibacter flexilis DSM 6793]|uniref:Glycosyltransferase 2-like domain-containing protein n=1 Tax=Flexibacter flexilis DSM 6793 TaxID=927664 RepID=A0A1I1G349_9BACT|nr:glycosyltransferase family 2 protein [Flexibacter flexilis]SFC04248.1 hypothetical protein SAMN05421780_102369 [Flexibacter flexilis DSM 6793]